MNFFLIALFAVSVHAALIAINPRLIGRTVHMTLKKQSKRGLTKEEMPRQCVVSPFAFEIPPIETKYKIAGSQVTQNLNQFLRDPKNIARLYLDPVPLHYLNNPYFFDGAVRSGNRALCSHLIRNGQQVKILKENGDNLLVRLIENGMSEIVGTLIEKKTAETLKALHAVDASTGQTPLSMAIKLGDRMAVYEIVSPRAELHNSPTNSATKRVPY